MEGPFLFNNLLRARGTVLLEQLIMSQGDSSSGKINCEPGGQFSWYFNVTVESV